MATEFQSLFWRMNNYNPPVFNKEDLNKLDDVSYKKETKTGGERLSGLQRKKGK